ncbi:MAG: hypothetical protein MUC58_09270 [Rhizobiaceae bacterium]|nr:hypothetical protein [Rhizobiaceae bacterium]
MGRNRYQVPGRVRRLLRTVALPAVLLAGVAGAAAAQDGAVVPPANAGAADLAFACGPIAIVSAETENTQIVQGTNGVFFRPRADFSYLLWPSDLVLNKFSRLNSVLKQRGVALVLAPLPPRALTFVDALGPMEAQGVLVDPGILAARFDRALARFRSAGIAVPAYGSADFMTPAAGGMFFKTDIHWAYDGVAFVAAKVAKAISDSLGAERLRGAVLPVARFEESAGTSVFFSAIVSSCEGDIPPPVIRRPIVEVTAETSDDLFGDAAKTIALAGSSFSDPKYGFDAELSRHLTQNIANLQVNGGQIDASMMTLLTSPAFQRGDHDMIIWETLLSYDLDRLWSTFREMPALAAGRCTGARVIAEAQAEGGGPITLVVPSGRAVSGEDHYVWLDFSDPSVTRPTVLVMHEAITAPVSAIEIPDAFPGTVDIALCQSPLRGAVR